MNPKKEFHNVYCFLADPWLRYQDFHIKGFYLIYNWARVCVLSLFIERQLIFFYETNEFIVCRGFFFYLLFGHASNPNPKWEERRGQRKYEENQWCFVYPAILCIIFSYRLLSHAYIRIRTELLVRGPTKIKEKNTLSEEILQIDYDVWRIRMFEIGMPCT